MKKTRMKKTRNKDEYYDIARANRWAKDAEDVKKTMIIDVLIEIPKGSRNKYEYDKEKKLFKFDTMLFSAVHYPGGYGFIPDTLARDGDPLDALVLVWNEHFPDVL